ncbi:MAG: hypothetical protein E6767_03560 [Dysgonomonas sp.]|nr:hypothetical protein [Dysgonomonas sp.]
MMQEFKYTLTEEDFLYLQLYTASKDENVKKQRKMEKYRLAGFSVICGLVLLFDDFYQYYAYFLLVGSVLLLFVYPFWSAWYYKRMFKKRIHETYKDRFPSESMIGMNDESISITNQGGHYTFIPSDVNSIVETGKYFYLKLNQFICVIPKTKVDEKIIQDQLMRYHNIYNVTYITDLDWKWK